jgi:hypothetical protein
VQEAFNKAISLVLSAAIVGTFGWLGLEAFRDYRTFGDEPLRTSVAGAVEASATGRQWVSVVGAPWRCAELLRGVPGGAAFLPASAPEGATIVARFDQPIRCEAVVSRPLIGIVEPMAPQRARDLGAAGLRLPADAPLRTLEVCSSCGKDNARMGILVCAVFVLVGLALYPLRHLLPAWRGSGVLVAAIHAPAEQAAAANRTIRLWGLAVVVCGVVATTVGRGFVVYGVIPVPWFGAFAFVLGGLMAAFPERYRQFAKRRPR